MNSTNKEQTLALIKPDALKNSLTGYVLSLLAEFHTGLSFAATKIVRVPRILAEEHYAEHRGKPFFPPLIDYIMGKSHYPNRPDKQRVIAIVYQGPDAVKKLREIAGPTNPHQAREQKPGCIRSLGTLVPLVDAQGSVIGQRMDNLIHASANEPEAEREVKLWFRPNDIPPYMHIYATRRCNEHYYYLKGKLFTTYEPESVCILAPGDLAWESDLCALEAIIKDAPPPVSLGTVVAKYLINDVREDD